MRSSVSGATPTPKRSRKRTASSPPNTTPIKPDTSAEERFKEVAAAYGVIGDPERRARYDRYGHTDDGAAGFGGGFPGGSEIFSDLFDMFGRGVRGAGAEPDLSLRVRAQISFVEMAKGVEKTVRYKRLAACVTCSGHGTATGRPAPVCGHCGDVECRIDPNTGRMDYFGPTANRAARLAKAAHEGQILVSESLQAGAPTSEQWTLHDLGLHRLRGLERPLRLFEVKPSGLEGRRFPPPQTLDATQTNLSARRDRFIGRNEQLEQIAEWFTKGRRLITLTGVSGIGKTRLALRFGGLHLDRFEGGGGSAT